MNMIITDGIFETNFVFHISYERFYVFPYNPTSEKIKNKYFRRYPKIATSRISRSAARALGI